MHSLRSDHVSNRITPLFCAEDGNGWRSGRNEPSVNRDNDEQIRAAMNENDLSIKLDVEF